MRHDGLSFPDRVVRPPIPARPGRPPLRLRSRALDAERLDHGHEIVGRLVMKDHALAAVRMNETQRARVQHRARRIDHRSAVVADVNALADEGMAALRQVDAYLMLAAGLEAALDPRRTGEMRKRRDMRDRRFAVVWSGAPGTPEVSVRAAQSVAAIVD